MHRQHRALWLCLFMMLALTVFFPAAAQQEQPEQRALLIASDFFLSQANTWPASANNAKAIEEAFAHSSRPFSLIRTLNSTLNSFEGLQNAVQEAFGQAGPEDVSYFYISTHGVYDANASNLDAYLLLSDGVSETRITARQLEACFNGIAGTKVILIDACQSGAIIGKGVSGGTTQAAFLGPDFKVLTSSGGSEDSWYWSSAETHPGQATGSSYFSTVLTMGLSAQTGFEADASQDGEITLNELYDYLTENHSASTPQVYPQQDDFVFFTYDREAYLATGPTGMISGVQFEDTLLDAQTPTVSFSFTVKRPVQLAYQLVYYQEGRWQFDQAQLIYDNQELGGDYGDRQGYVSPGRKLRSLTLSSMDEEAYGYVMVQLITFQDGVPTLHASRVLCVPPAQGDPLLEVKTGHDFAPGAYRELPILVNHQYPCQLTVSVYSESGQLTARLAANQSTRPQQLTPLASAFYWNGRNLAGQVAPPGKYYIAVQATLGGDIFTTRSNLFELMESTG